MALARKKQIKPLQTNMPKLTDQKVADIVRCHLARLAAEHRTREAIKRGDIPPPPRTTSWNISDRH